jgi:hypothetical protein
MGPDPKAAQARFEKLAKRQAGPVGESSPRRAGFGTGSLFVGRKMFGLRDARGALALKLAPDPVHILTSEGTGSGWHPGTGKPLKEYVAIGPAHEAKWLGLAQESREYVLRKR